MKVLVATHSYTGNGAAVMLLAVLEYWVKVLGWTVDVIFSLENEVPEELAQTGVTAFSTADAKTYDFALVNTLVSSPYLEALARHVPTVLWVHEGETALWTSTYPPVRWRALFDLPHKIIFQTPWQSDVVFRSFLSGNGQAKVACIKNGMPRIPAGIEADRKTSNKKRIVFVGGVYARKRPEDLIDAVLAMRRSDIECLFVGSTTLLQTIGSEHLDRLHSYSEVFKIIGEVNRKRALEYLASADVFCLPSGDESQPVAPLEAAAFDVPCILSDLPPYAGIWKHGINCLMHPIGHVALLRQNLSAAIDDAGIRQPMVAEARQLVSQFSPELFLRRFTAEMPASQ